MTYKLIQLNFVVVFSLNNAILTWHDLFMENTVRIQLSTFVTCHTGKGKSNEENTALYGIQYSKKRESLSCIQCLWRIHFNSSTIQ